MKQPFIKYVCDVCGKTIRVEDGMLQWLQKPADVSEAHPFEEELVSIHICCRKASCYSFYTNRGRKEGLHEQWVHLDTITGSENLDELLSFPLERKISQQSYIDFLEITRRLQLPYYEEARQFFPQAEEDGFCYNLDEYKHGHRSWRQDLLQSIIEEYAKE